ncbi:MAG: glycosyltransferase [Mucilaginibacter sp.]|nr:glycosyltransferase [Mucilaginibacter sp.]
MDNNKQETTLTRKADALISVIIPTYNSVNILENCLQSIFNQTEKDIQVVIIDGGSTDGTLELIKKHSANIGYYASEADRGIYDAMNKGIAAATGHWLYFMGADDRLLPGFSQMAKLLLDENTVYYGDVSSDGDMLKGPFSAYRLAKYCMNHQTIFYPAAVFKKYSYNKRYKVYADYALNLQVWGDTSFKKQHYPIKVVWYDLTGFSATNNDELFKKEKPLIIRRSMGWLMYLRFLYKRNKEQRKKGSNFY